MSMTKRIRCVETNRVFPSLASAGHWIGAAGRRSGSRGGSLEGAHIGQAAIGYRGQHTAGGYHWAFVDKQYPKVAVAQDWSVYKPPVIKASDPIYSSGRSRVGCDHLRRWVVLSKEVDGKVQCSIDRKWYPTMIVQVSHIRPFNSCSAEDRYHRDSSLPMSMGLHKLYDFFKFTILPDGTISVLDKNFWEELTKLDGQAVLGWREENARFCRNSQVFSRAA
jgi:hypothetical protein